VPPIPDPRAPAWERLRARAGPGPLPGPRHARSENPSPLLRGAVILVTAAVVLTALLFWQARPKPVDDPGWGWSSSVPPSTYGPSSASPSDPASSVRWLVHVVGRVRRPGVVALDPGARVADAVRAAGGLRPGTDPSAINLARPVSDGEQLVIGGPQNRTGPQATPGSGRLDLNSADAAALEALDGVGPVLAGRIIEWRETHGRFTRVEDLQRINGIGPRTFAALADQVTV
jgi:competence protein ComEA